ncbi:MAG: RNA 2',3'-cyclic phosphodiesterase [Desulfuromonadaceae bacterium]|nr:RNA 2',3'-cyclic phosphodiesterase [Desulfuromonadaceae bacterium]
MRSLCEELRITTMRLFLAINLDGPTTRILASCQQPLRQCAEARLSFPGHFHLTLKFLGDVEPAQLPLLRQALSPIRFAPFRLSLAALGSFPGRGKPRVIWIGVSPWAPLNALQQQIETQLSGLFPADASFHPHLTLARIKQLNNRAALNKALQQCPPINHRIEVQELSLLRSHLERSGARYETLLTIPATLEENEPHCSIDPTNGTC